MKHIRRNARLTSVAANQKTELAKEHLVLSKPLSRIRYLLILLYSQSDDERQSLSMHIHTHGEGNEATIATTLPKYCRHNFRKLTGRTQTFHRSTVHKSASVLS